MIIIEYFNNRDYSGIWKKLDQHLPMRIGNATDRDRFDKWCEQYGGKWVFTADGNLNIEFAEDMDASIFKLKFEI